MSDVEKQQPPRPRVAVIGGGAAGTVTAVHLLRGAGRTGVEVVLLDSSGVFGPGVAYATDDPQHLLNVPAIRSGAIAGDPEHFHRWLADRGEAAAAAAFIARGIYGAYLQELLDTAEAETTERATLKRVAGEVIALAPHEREGRPLTLELAGGELLGCDHAVLAIGPLPGANPFAVPAALERDGRYIADPWAPGALSAAHDDREVLILGSGLTMVDVALSLAGADHGPRVRALSRNGYLPRPHRAELTHVEAFSVPLDSGELEPVLAVVAERIAEVTRRGGDWRDVIDSMRPLNADIWRSLSIAEKRAFLTRINRFWDVHRFRMAPAVAERLEGLRASGRVEVQAGAVSSLELGDGCVRVFVQEQGARSAVHYDVDRVINCTGAGADLRLQAPRLLANMLAAGSARPDELGLGLDVDQDGGLIDRAGHAAENIHVVGALRKGVEWETIGVTEIRDQAARIAQRI